MADNRSDEDSRRETTGTRSGAYPWGTSSFDYVNWYYWCIWWQQYWLCQAAQLYGSPGTPADNSYLPTAPPDTSTVNGGHADQLSAAQQQHQQWALYVQHMTQSAHLPRPSDLSATPTERQRRPELLLRINLLRGGFVQ